MNFIDAFIRKYFFVLFAIALVWNAGYLMYKSWRRFQNGPKFSKVSAGQIRFREHFASGYSHKSWMTRLGGASNCLSVTVTTDELWVTSFFPFNLFADTYDLEHRVPLCYIVHVEQQKQQVNIDFKVSNSDLRRLTLISRKASELSIALAAHSKSDRTGASNSSPGK